MRKRGILAAGVISVLLAGCGSTEPASRKTDVDEPTVATAASQQRDDDCSLLAGVGPTLAAVDNSFGPDCATVRSDAVLYVQNLGRFKHTFTISEEAFGTKPFLLDVILPTGDKKPISIDLSDLEVGTYEFFCSLHGSMDGVLELIAPVGG